MKWMFLGAEVAPVSPMALDYSISASQITGALRWIGLVVLAVMILVTVWSAVEARMVRVATATLTSPVLPEAFDGTRVVFVADVHAGPYFGARSMRALVKLANQLQPDVIVLGGDYVGGMTGGAKAFYPAAAGLSAPLGVYAVLGNHDAWEGEQLARSALASAGITLLDNTNVRLDRDGASVRLAGVQDMMTGSPDVSAAASGIDDTEFAVLVSHNPDLFATELPRHSDTFDLALAGHTHAGQLTLFGMAAPIVPSRHGERYREGWRTEEGVPILVSRGAGTVGLPLRFFARPEIHLIELRRGPAGVDPV